MKKMMMAAIVAAFVLFAPSAFAVTPGYCIGKSDGNYYQEYRNVPGGDAIKCQGGKTLNACEGNDGKGFRPIGGNIVGICKGGSLKSDTFNYGKRLCVPPECPSPTWLPEANGRAVPPSGGGSSGGGSSGGGSSSGGTLEIVDIPGQQPPKKDSSGGGSSGGSSDGIGPVGGWLSDDEADKQSKQKAREEKEKQEKEKEKKKDGGNVPDPSAPPGNTDGSYPFGKKDLESAKRLMEALKAHQKRWADKWTDIANEANAIKANLADELSRCDFYHKNNPKTYENCVKTSVSNAAEKSEKLNEKIEVFKRMQAIEEKALNEQIQELNPISKLIVNAFSGFTIPDGSSSSKTTEKTGDDKNGTTKEVETITEKTSDGGGNGGGVVNNYNTQTNNITTTNNQTINNEIVNKIETRDYTGALNALNGSLQALSRDIEGQTNVLNNSLNLGFAGLSGRLGDLIAKVDKLDSGNGGGPGGSGGGGNVANGNGSAAKASGEGDGQSDLEAFCKKHPNTLTCAEFNGNIPEEGDFSGLIPKKEVKIGWKFEDFLKGSSVKCPAPMKFNTMVGVISLSWDGFCEFLRMVRGFVIMAASVTGIMIVLKGQ